MKSYTAAQGSKFTIEWFVDEKGYSPSFSYFEKISPSQQDKVIALFNLMANFGKIWDQTKFRNEGDGIYVFKTNQDRFFCFFVKGGKIIVTNAYTKKSQKMSVKEKEKALAAQKNYIKRVSEGIYYEEEN